MVGGTSEWPFTVQKWESGCPVGCLPFQQPAYPPKSGTVLHLAFFVAPAALSAAAMAHGVLCHRHKTKHLLQEKHREGTALWNSALLKTVQLLSRKVQRDPALKDERQAQGQPGEKKYRLSLTFLGESFPLGLTQHWALLQSPEHFPADTSHCPRQNMLGLQGTLMGSAKWLCWGAQGLWAWPWHPSAPEHPAKVLLKQVRKYPGVSWPAFLRKHGNSFLKPSNAKSKPKSNHYLSFLEFAWKA